VYSGVSVRSSQHWACLGIVPGGEQVIVALEGDAGNLDKLVTVARECGFRKLLSALVKDLQKAQAETIEIIAMAAADELREPDCQRLKGTN